jgi:lipopolysaccharide transport system ATP-binding protein
VNGALALRGIGKAYRRYPGRWSRLREWLTGQPQHQRCWTLRDIDLAVQPGEAVGLVGMNGAGKSTLLRIITGTTTATTGEVRVGGRVAALLELGMGFHPDFSGRQNVWMAGQLQGLSEAELQGLFPAIEAFAEIGDYMDQPLRVYSSGMQVRLAFAVATAVRPDVLIVDEALAVGDAYFQHKSFGRIREFRDQGTTLLLVSHDRQAIQSLCSRVVLLDGGRVLRDGEPEATLDFYNGLMADRQNHAIEQSPEADGRTLTVSGSGAARILSVTLHDGQGAAVETVRVGQAVDLRVRVAVHHDLPELVLGYQLRDRLGHVVFGTNTWYTGAVRRDLPAGQQLEFSLRFEARLGAGSYSVSVALHAASSHVVANYEWRDLALVFEVVNVDQQTFVGSAWLPPTIGCRVTDNNA